MVQEKIIIKFKAKGSKPLIDALNKLAKAQAGVTKGLGKYSGAGARASKNTNKLTASQQLLGGTLSVVRSKLLIYTFAFSAFNRVLFQSVKALAEQEKAEAKVARVLTTTGHAAKITATELKSYARHIAETTEFADELVISAEAMLLTFTKINGEVFKDALSIAADMSVAFGQDLKSSVIQVGKALNDPAKGFTALRRIGVSFSKEQEKLIKNFTKQNDLASAQKVILDELQTEFGGVASSVGKTAITVAQLGMAWGDFVEVFGDTIAPVITPALKSLTDFFKFFQSDMVKTESTLRRWGATEEDIKKSNMAFLQSEILLSEARNKVSLENLKTQAEAVGIVQKLQEALKGQAEGTDKLRSSMIEANNVLNDFGFGTDEARNALMVFLDAHGKMDLSVWESAKIALQRFVDSGIEGTGEASKFFSKATEDQKKLVISSLELILANEQKLTQDNKNIEAQKEYNNQVVEMLRLMGLLPSIVVTADTKFQEFWKNNQEGASILVSSFSNMTSALQGNLDARMKSELDALKATSKYQRADADRRKQMEKDKMAEFKKERLKLWQFEKASNLAEAGINIATAITKAMAATGILAPILVPAIAAMGAVQIAAIASTKPPKFAQGGLIGGRRHSAGGTMINAEQGEFVMSRSAVESVGLESLNRMNQGGGGGNITVNVSGNVLSQDFVEGELAENIKEAIRRGTDFGIS